MVPSPVQTKKFLGADLLVVIVGPTATGKTQLALDVATRFGGEVIAADSRTVYKGLDVGTAKPTLADRCRVRHHLLDVVSVDQPFNVARFQGLGQQALSDIRSRQRLPIVVGGSGLYVAALALGYDFTQATDVSFDRRLEFQNMSLEDLRDLIRERNLLLPRDPKNRRRLIRVLEKNQKSLARKSGPPEGSLWVGLKPSDDVLRQRIESRFDWMLANRVVDEAAWLLENCPPSSEAAKGNVYRCLAPYIAGEIDLITARSDFIRSDLHLVKKQMTWFRRYDFIDWFEGPSTALDHIAARLAT